MSLPDLNSANSTDQPHDANLEQSSHRGQSHLISRVLTPALRLWLRSQVEHVEDLQVHIQAGDRQLLSGAIETLSLSAQNVVYRGLHLAKVELTGSNIRINLGQVLRGKPLRLLQPIPVMTKITIDQSGLNQSLRSPLLADALQTTLRPLLQSAINLPDDFENADWNLKDVAIASDSLTLNSELTANSGQTLPLIVRTGLAAPDGKTLCLQQPHYLMNPKSNRGLPLSDLEGLAIDMGNDVDVQEFTLKQEKLLCRGTIKVIPGD